MPLVNGNPRLLKFTKTLVIFTLKVDYLENDSNDFVHIPSKVAPVGVPPDHHSGFTSKTSITMNFGLKLCIFLLKFTKILPNS